MALRLVVERQRGVEPWIGAVARLVRLDPGRRARERPEQQEESHTAEFRTAHRASFHWPIGATRDVQTPELTVAARADTTVRWSPLLYDAPTTASRARLTAIYAVLPLRLVQSRAPGLDAFGSVDPESERAAMARLGAYTPPPSLILHEGARLVPMWLLREPLAVAIDQIDEAKPGRWTKEEPDGLQAQRLLWNIALAVGGDRTALNSRTMLLQVPGTPAHGIFPRVLVTVHLGNVERRFTADEF